MSSVHDPQPSPSLPTLLVLHAQWFSAPAADSPAGLEPAMLHVWAEQAGPQPGSSLAPPAHSFAADHAGLTAALQLPPSLAAACLPATLLIALPESADHLPIASPAIAHTHGGASDEDVADIEPAQHPTGLGRFTVPTLRVPSAHIPALLDHLDDLAARDEDDSSHGSSARLLLGDGTRFFAAASRFVRHLLAQHRFVPMLGQEGSGNLRGVWQPWLGDQANFERVSRLLAFMPPAARACVDILGHDGRSILDDFILRLGDALCRSWLLADSMHEAIEGRDPRTDLHVAWLSGLLAPTDVIDSSPATRSELVRGVRRWIGGLEERGSGAAWRLLLRLREPLDVAGLNNLAPPTDSVRWPLSLLLQSTINSDVVIEAEDIWTLPHGAASIDGLRIEAPQEVLLAELGRAARLFKKLEKALEQSEPSELDLTTSEAYQFLREIKPLLIEQGVGVLAPDWWDSPTVRLGARLQVESDDVDFARNRLGAGSPGAAVTHLGLSSLVSYRWQIAVGENNLSLEQFEKLVSQHSPLVQLNGRWVEIRPEDVKAAIRFIRENPGGQMEVGRALRLAYASDVNDTGIPILGMDATGWVATVFGDARSNEKLPLLESPQGFIGTLRPYQIKGLSWLAFLDRFGLGACLADDMGLGKTIQLLALLAHERATLNPDEPRPGPTLLVVPMSVVSNWVHEARRFTPSLKVIVQHGVERKIGESLLNAALAADVVITTYALAHRDREHLGQIPWSRVVLDEAQNIKNPGAKQTRAVHALNAPRRIALTGTPLENRLTELWSIMDFLNPGYLGSGGEFRRKFALAIERYHDKQRGAQLRGLVQPFVLRRLKSDPTVISDLPEKVETKEYCYLTPEQATLYQTCVSDMLAAAEKSEGIQRRGLVLAGLIKLKQICNHPAHFLKEMQEADNHAQAMVIGASISPSRSGKTQRIVEMLQEVVAAGDKALVFTQFRQMGHLLQAVLRQHLDRDVLFLHGGTPAAQRQAIVSEFQGEIRPRNKSATSGPPILVLSLKAGGVGLNLTAANHVFHFDRWWNPAVESQATDRAYRIGQTRTVQVHKFVVSGSLEERIDQMIEEKMSLASEIIGAGEEWITELSTNQLRDLLTLRADAIGDEDASEEPSSLVPAGQTTGDVL